METPLVMEVDDLPRTEHAHEFVGAEHGAFRSRSSSSTHGAAAFDTEWVSEPDPVWASKPER